MSYSDKPLRLVGSWGWGSRCFFFLVAFSLYRYYRNDVTAGWTSVLASIWLVGGIAFPASVWSG